jgi:UDP-4-amino-4,6-dideoxy-N-acetyl-beta-L-altrosamine transaminase
MADRLALHGGVPVRANALPYARQTIDDLDVQAVTDALRSDWLTTGPLVEAFERAVASLVEAEHAVAVNSGTAALHAAVFAAGIGDGDEVITSPLTFVASANAVLYQGGRPVFADIRPDTLALDPADVAAKLTGRTRAVLPVDFAGQPCDLDAILVLGREKGLVVIEDAAHALGAAYRGRPIGSHADLTTFSFHPAKTITTGEGGMVTTNRDELAARLRRFRNHGFGMDYRERAARSAPYSPMVDLGYNYRLPDLLCALGLSQLGRLEQLLKRRSEIAERYSVAVAALEGVKVLRPATHVRPAWHIFPILLGLDRLRADRDTILAALRAENIGAAVHYVPAYWHPYYQALGYRHGLCPLAEAVYARTLTLPIFPAMTDRDVEDVLTALSKVLAYYSR